MNNQIKEIAKDLKKCLPSDWYWSSSVDADVNIVAKHFYNIGYRNEKETAKEILQFLNEHTFQDASQQIVKTWFKERFGVEVK